MIFTERQITIRNGKSTINEPVILYRGDYEVSIRFTIMESKFRFKSGVNLVDSEKASHGQLAILTPYGDSVISDIVKCEDGTVTFTLSKEMIDQLEEVGLYSFQIRLFDYYRESRISIPPVEFGIEVREPVASEDHNNIVGDGIVGYAIAKYPMSKVTDGLNEDYDGPTFDDDGQYNKTDWEIGDRISQGKLNKIEDAIDQINQNEKTLDKRVTNNFNVMNAIADSKASNADLDVERKRINLLSATSNSATEGNSELLDIRVGASGTVYTTAGESVRNQISDIKNFVLPDVYLDIPRAVYALQDNLYGYSISGTYDEFTIVQTTEVGAYTGFNIEIPRTVTSLSFDVEYCNFGLNLGLYVYDGVRLRTAYMGNSDIVSNEVKNKSISYEIDWSSVDDLLKDKGGDNLRLIVWARPDSVANGYNRLTNISVNGYQNTNKLAARIQNVEDIIDDKIEMEHLTTLNIKNAYETFTTSDIESWATNDIFQHNNNGVIFSYNKPTGNAGIQTPNAHIKHPNTYIRVEYNVVSIVGNMSISLHYTNTEGKDTYSHIGGINSEGEAAIYIDCSKYNINFDKAVNVIFSNSGTPFYAEVTNILVNYTVFNDDTEYLFEHINKMYNDINKKTVSYDDVTHEKTYILADCRNLIQWSGLTHLELYETKIIYSYTGTGNGGVITSEFTPNDTFLRISGNITELVMEGGAKLQTLIVGKSSIDGRTLYINTKYMNATGDFSHSVDLANLAVYKELDLSKPIQVLLSTIGVINSVTIENYKISEDKFAGYDLVKDTLDDTLINMSVAINKLENSIGGLDNTNSNIMIAPNGEKFVMQVANDGSLIGVPVIPNKTLVIGNSLTLGFGTFGMCATDNKNDYYYHLEQYLQSKKSTAYIKRILGSPYEMAESQSVLDTWLADNIDNEDADYDLVIIQLSDNVNNEVRNELFKTSCSALIKRIRNVMPKARVAWVSAWYTNSQKQAIVRDACTSTGSIMIDITDLAVINENKGSIGDVITYPDGTTRTVTSTGVASHPGNLGMKAIADRIVDVLFEQ